MPISPKHSPRVIRTDPQQKISRGDHARTQVRMSVRTLNARMSAKLSSMLEFDRRRPL
jgi:hypothetical protein